MAEVRQRLEQRLALKPAAEWCELLGREGIPSGPIYNVPEMLQDEHMRARGLIVEQAHPTAGTLRTLACPVRLSGTPASYRLPPPLLGQHTEAILAELGYSPAEICRLQEAGAI